MQTKIDMAASISDPVHFCHSRATLVGMSDTPTMPMIVLSDRVALGDASALLSRRNPGKRRKVPRERDPNAIRYCVIHKSGADGPPGLRGAQGMARFVIDHRGWDDPAYTFWLPRVPDVDTEGRFLALRCNPDTTRSWHTGGDLNDLGVSIAFQGAYDGDGGEIEVHPTEAQLVMAAALLDHLEATHPAFRRQDKDEQGRYLLTGHWEHGKAICPGDAITLWTRTQRGEGLALRAGNVADPTATEVRPLHFGIASRQLALRAAGYDPGPIDGMQGYQTRAALERFQRAQGLRVDGHWGKHTAAAMLVVLRALGLSSVDAFADLGEES